MSVATKMTAIADKIRNLLGISGAMGLDSMTSNLGTAVTEVDSQTELISQITSALEGKAGGGGISLPTLSNEGSESDLLSGKQLINSDGNIVTGTIPIKTSTDISMNGALISIPKGYYSSNIKHTIEPAIPVDVEITINDNGLITSTCTQYEGYITDYNITETLQLTTQAAKTITPTESSQTAVAKNVYTTGAITVAAIPSTHENVATETSAYTTELSELAGQISALESALEGKAAGGGGGGEYTVETGTFTTRIDITIDPDYAYYELIPSVNLSEKDYILILDVDNNIFGVINGLDGLLISDRVIESFAHGFISVDNYVHFYSNNFNLSNFTFIAITKN